jgi:hypothetical protein
MTNKRRTRRSLKHKIRVFKKRFAKLDKKSKIQLIAIFTLTILIIFVAVIALLGKGENPAIDDISQSGFFDSSFENTSDSKYEDFYAKEIEKYHEVVIKKSKSLDEEYLKDTVFVGDSNTEGLGAFYHLSLQNVLGAPGMGIQSVVSTPCIWFVGV